MISVYKTKRGTYEMVISRSGKLFDPKNKIYSGQTKEDVLKFYYADVDKVDIDEEMKEWRKGEMKRFFNKHVN
jgi:hypothetical protein